MSHSLRNIVCMLLLATLLIWVTPRAIAMVPGPIEEDDVPPPPTATPPVFPEPEDLASLPGNVPLPEWQKLPVRAYAQCLSIGLPNRGALRGGVLFPRDNAFYIADRADRQWGTPETIDALIYAAAKVQARYGHSHKLYLGDISYRDGGRLRRHMSHQAGRDADVGFYFKTGSPGYLADGVPSNIDLKRNWAFLEALLELNAVQYIFLDTRIQRVLYNYAKNRRHVPVSTLDHIFQYPRSRRERVGIIRHARGHYNHYHIRFYSPIAVANAKRALFNDPELVELRNLMYGQRTASIRTHTVASTSRVTYRTTHNPAPARSRSSNTVIYTVRKGDSLWSIAKRHGITVNQLRSWNNLGASSRLKVGQKLTIYKNKKRNQS